MIVVEVFLFLISFESFYGLLDLFGGLSLFFMACMDFFVQSQPFRKRKIFFQKRKNLFPSLAMLVYLPQICTVNHNGFSEMAYGKYVRRMPHCLECGDQIEYGRTDKKFCCEDCRMKYHYTASKMSKTYRRKILKTLSRNYLILESLVKSDTLSMDLADLVPMGFVPGVVTSYRRNGKHEVYYCFDIKYIMTATRIYSVGKIQNLSVILQVGTELKD